MDVYNLISFLGIFILIAFAWLLSADRRNFNIRLIAWAVVLQLLTAVFIFRVPAGSRVFLAVNEAVVNVLESASEGARFVFGRLALPPGHTDASGNESIGPILAFQAFPTIIFFSALISVLYYLRIMPVIIRGFAWVFTRLMRVSGAESLVAASNIFVGVESALAVKPYLGGMTRSEFCTVLTVGMATVASNVLALYVFSLQDIFPAIAGHLVSASLLSAPAALAMSKILLPESDAPQTLGVRVRPYCETEASLFEAVISGAHAGVKMTVGIVALLIAVLGLVALVNLLLGGVGGWINSLLGLTIDWSIETLFGWLFYPFVLIMGIPPTDAPHIARIIGERIVLTEVVSYQDLAAAMRAGVFQSERSPVIATYALCGFAHLASMAIFVGGVSAIARERTRDIAAVAPRALLAATLACLMTACVAGAVFSHASILLGQ